MIQGSGFAVPPPRRGGGGSGSQGGLPNYCFCKVLGPPGSQTIVFVRFWNFQAPKPEGLQPPRGRTTPTQNPRPTTGGGPLPLPREGGGGADP